MGLWCTVMPPTSKVVIGYVLMQNRRVIACASKQLKDQNYLTHDLELAVSSICVYVKGFEFSLDEVVGLVERLCHEYTLPSR